MLDQIPNAIIHLLEVSKIRNIQFNFKCFEIIDNQIVNLIKPGEKNITTTQRLFSISLYESSWETIKKCAQDRYTKATNKNFDSSRSHFFVLFFFSLGKKDVSLVIGDLRGKEYMLLKHWKERRDGLIWVVKSCSVVLNEGKISHSTPHK